MAPPADLGPPTRGGGPAAEAAPVPVPVPVATVRLCVAVPTRDRKESILRALPALARQLAPGDELIVVDNGSVDGTGDAVAAWLSHHCPQGRVVRECLGGVSVARNRALRETTCPVVCFFDDDQLPDARWLCELRRAWAEAGPQVAVIGGPMRALWLGPRPEWLADYLLYGASVLDLGSEPHRLDQRPATGYVWGGNLSVRVDAALAVGGLDPQRGPRPDAPWERDEEPDLQRRLVRAGWEVWYEPRAAIDHVLAPSRLTPEHFRTVFRQQALADARRGLPRSAGCGRLLRAAAAYCLARARGDGAAAVRASFNWTYAMSFLRAPR